MAAAVLPEMRLPAPAAVEATSPAGAVVTYTATASDNRGVAAVQFKLDGANLGAEDVTIAYRRGEDAMSARPSLDAMIASGIRVGSPTRSMVAHRTRPVSRSRGLRGPTQVSP